MKRMLLVLAAIVAPVSFTHASNDAQPYAGLETREIKALSAERIDGLLQGKGLSYALAAELNGLPGPRHVLDMAQRLGLAAGKREQIEAIFERMNEAARELGRELVAAEARLERALAAGRATPEDVARLTGEIAELEGRLRAIHLTAHLETEPLLTPHQKRLYAAERGYSGKPAGAHEGHGRAH